MRYCILHDPRIHSLHNTNQGRCFVLGNGPSLLTQDLRPLRGEKTFCCNGFPKWRERPFGPTFYGVSDIKDADVFRRLPVDDLATPWKFNVQWESRRDVHDDRFIFVEKAPDNIQVHAHGLVGMGDTLPPVPTGRTTPLTLAQLALWLGFRRLYFLGIEQSGHGYVYAPEADTTTQGYSRADHPRYYLALQRCFARARQEVEAAGGVLADCTPGGFLSGHSQERAGVPARPVLPYVPLEEALQ